MGVDGGGVKRDWLRCSLGEEQCRQDGVKREDRIVAKVIITAAVTGSRPTKEMNPAVPYSPREIAQSAVECYRAGAAIAHIHVRNPETGRPDRA